jgi:hypothetical protein
MVRPCAPVRRPSSSRASGDLNPIDRPPELMNAYQVYRAFSLR